MLSCCKFKKKDFQKQEKKTILQKKKEPIIAKNREYTPAEIAGT
jgi:hypothetical protein